MATNWKAMQVAGAFKAKTADTTLLRPAEVLTRYLKGGSWRADLHRNGQKRAK